jgi:glutaredoxin 3
MPQVTVYTTEPCSFCARVKQLLATRGVGYEEVNLSKDPAGRAALAARTGMLSFPQVVVGDGVIGGFQETLAADRSGRLRRLLADEPA